ncbi:MAG: ankyrin repeat domain-containing protein, partial [Epsilonproteobacteria bacterium]
WAANRGHLNIVKFLVDKGADIHVCNDLALKWASDKGHVDVVEYLKSCGN